MPAVPEWLWLAWLAATLAAFAALETVALLNRHGGDTLSERLRRWLGVEPVRARRRLAAPLFAGALLAFLAWFLPHILWP